LSGRGLSKNITDSDIGNKPAKIKAKNIAARKTADILNQYLGITSQLLSRHPINRKRKKPANFLLLRACGSQKKVKLFRKKYGFDACSVSGIGIIKGISRYLGIKVATPNLSENYEKDLKSRIKLAEKMLKKYNFVMLHINGADIFGHDRDFKKKVAFLKKADNEIFSAINKLKDINIIVAVDHITSSKAGAHIFGKTPVLIYNGRRKNNINKFDETTCKKGFRTANPMKMVIKCS
jgi:2,3-bisphosphoglycerate-independent phosphoglycerate mutase